jgi:membrane protein YqaA with SNARE-associated domain
LKITNFLLLAGSGAPAIFRFFRRLGPWGLLVLSALDSSFLVLPFGNDLLLIGLVSADRNGPAWLLYVLVSVAGSLIGVWVVDLVMRKAGEKGLEYFVSRVKIEQLKRRIENKAGITVFVATVMPPPFPFTPVIMTASALQYPRNKLFGAVALGRLVRFTIEAVLALYFGRHVIRFIRSEIWAYVAYGLLVIGAIGTMLTILKWINRKTHKATVSG